MMWVHVQHRSIVDIRRSNAAGRLEGRRRRRPSWRGSAERRWPWCLRRCRPSVGRRRWRRTIRLPGLGGWCGPVEMRPCRGPGAQPARGPLREPAHQGRPAERPRGLGATVHRLRLGGGRSLDLAQLDTLWGWIHDPQHEVHALLVVDDEHGDVGLAHDRPLGRPITASTGCFLDDRYVAEHARGTGAVDALLTALRGIGAATYDLSVDQRSFATRGWGGPGCRSSASIVSSGRDRLRLSPSPPAQR